MLGQVKNLGAELFQFTFLTKLYLNDNQLTSIPGSIARLEKLETLGLDYSSLPFHVPYTPIPLYPDTPIPRYPDLFHPRNVSMMPAPINHFHFYISYI